jgi:HEAT repeat protein
MKSFISRILTALLVLTALASSKQAAGQNAPARGKPSSDALARARELSSLTRSAGSEKLSKIRSALTDESWYVRGEAAKALGGLADSESAPLILPLLEDPSWYVRECAMGALSALGRKEAATAIEPLLTSPDPYIRARAAFTLGALKQEGAASSLLKLLEDEDEHVRRNAALALGALRESAATNALLALLKDADSGVRRNAVISLGLIGDRRAAEPVLAAAKENGGISWEYAAALYRLGNRDYYKPIIDALESEYGDHRVGAFEALVDLAEPRALSSLLAASKKSAGNGRAGGASDDSFSMRLMLARNIFRFKSEPAREAALDLVEDSSREVRAAAAESLKRMSKAGDASAEAREIESLIAALGKEKDPAVTDALIGVLALYDGAKVAEALLSSNPGKGISNENYNKALEAIQITPDRMIANLKSGAPQERSLAAWRQSRGRAAGCGRLERRRDRCQG